jgi:hypothetical protein
MFMDMYSRTISTLFIFVCLLLLCDGIEISRQEYDQQTLDWIQKRLESRSLGKLDIVFAVLWSFAMNNRIR